MLAASSYPVTCHALVSPATCALVRRTLAMSCGVKRRQLNGLVRRRLISKTPTASNLVKANEHRRSKGPPVLPFIDSARRERALNLVKVFSAMDGPVERPQPAGRYDGVDEIIADLRHPLVGEVCSGEGLLG